MQAPGKLAILSHVLPPSTSGQAVMLYRLLRGWDPAAYCLLSVKDYTHGDEPAADSVTRRLPATYHHLPAEFQLRIIDSRPFRLARRLYGGVKALRRALRPGPPTPPAMDTAPGASIAPSAPAMPIGRFARFKLGCRAALQGWDDWWNLRSQLAQRARAVARVLRQEGCTGVVACSGDLLDPPAGFLAAREVGIPFYAYMFDDYTHQWIMPSRRRFGQGVCAQVVGQADGVIVPNEFLADFYRQTYGIESTIVRNPVEVIPPLTSRPRTGGPFRIVFTGTIYEAHFDAFIRMMQAVARLEGKAELHLYTHSSPRFLANNGVGWPAQVHPSVSAEEAQAIQRSADALFLPLAFSSPYPQIINTSAPGKMGEYLASGRPVLVHSPRESYLSWYCRKHACAAVVDAPNADWLYHAIVELMDRSDLTEALVTKAWQRAQQDFHLPGIQRVFEQFFETHRPAAAA